MRDMVPYHVLDSVTSAAIKILIAECWEEMAKELDVPSNFAFDLIVDAVASASRCADHTASKHSLTLNLISQETNNNVP